MNVTDGPRVETSKCWLIAGLGLALDQLTKSAIAGWLHHGDSIAVTSFFNLVHVMNPGGAFSLLADRAGWQRWFFSAIALIASAILTLLICRAPRPEYAVAYAMILAGTLGNLVDRLVRGAVVDWLDFHWGPVHWLAFNAADGSITIGAAWLVIAGRRSSATEPKAAEDGRACSPSHRHN